MFRSGLRQTFFCFCLLLGITSATAHSSKSDSLQVLLAHTENPQARVDLLLNLKDLNEDTPLNLPLSIRLFREAASQGDTYAMSVAIIPIVTTYANYLEKKDSVDFCIRQLHQMTPGTPEEGFGDCAEMLIGCYQMNSSAGREKMQETAREIIKRYDGQPSPGSNIYEQAKLLTLLAYAKTALVFHDHGNTMTYVPQTEKLEEAYELTLKMPNLYVRNAFSKQIFVMLCIAYNQAGRFSDTQRRVNEYIALLDSCHAAERTRQRRPYLNTYKDFIDPYQLVLAGAFYSGRPHMAKQYIKEFRQRMLAAAPANLARNTSYIYEMGYLWYGTIGDNNTSLRYCDSLIRLITDDKTNFTSSSEQLLHFNHDRSRLLYRTGRYDDSYKAFQRTSVIKDSLYAVERRQRAETIRRSHEMDRLKLEETRVTIRNRIIAVFSFAGIVLLLVGLSIYQYRMLRRNRQMQDDILRHSRKAQESEHMKSKFINSVCRGIGPPLNAIGSAAGNLMVADPKDRERLGQLEVIRSNTKLLLSTLDNMLEAANLDSLTDHLQLKEVNIDELCQTEVLAISRLNQNSNVDFRIETPETACTAETHAKYFSFVVRALLDNAARFTRQGHITLRYEIKNDRLHTSITDTGCGISPEQRKNIFKPLFEHTTVSSGLSLALCRTIAERLSGSILLDETYTEGARFIFIIPVRP